MANPGGHAVSNGPPGPPLLGPHGVKAAVVDLALVLVLSVDLTWKFHWSHCSDTQGWVKPPAADRYSEATPFSLVPPILGYTRAHPIRCLARKRAGKHQRWRTSSVHRPGRQQHWGAMKKTAATGSLKASPTNMD